MSKAIGVDLGTYNSTAAFAMGSDVIMVESRYGKTPYGKNFPSFVLFDHNGKKQAVGKSAKAELGYNPKVVIWGVKRLVGLSYEEAKRRGELERFQYDIESGPGGSILIKVGEERYTPSHILEFILREIKEDAENPRVNPTIGTGIERAVISVPAYFDGTRIGPVVDAAKNAGFGDIETIAEPTAAAVQYGLQLDEEAKILAFDIGAGTLDVTVMLLLREGDQLLAGELSTSGHEALGGIDMDDMLTSYIIQKYKLSGIEENRDSMATLKDEVERAKRVLSTRKTTPLDLPNGPSIDLTRKELEDVLEPLLEKCRGPIRVALQQAGLEAEGLHHVLFVGGPTYMPCVRATVKEELKRLGASKELLQELASFEKGLPVDPMECVARGAALKAGGVVEPSTRTDPNGYGVIVNSDCFYSIIPANSEYPISLTRGIVHHNPEARRVPVSLAKKLPYDEGEGTVYKYYYLGEYDCYIRSTGDCPLIDVTMQLDDDKVFIVTLTHGQTRESVTFERLNEMKGNEIKLRELDEGGSGGEEGEGEEGKRRVPPPPPPTGRRRDWTQEQLTRAVHVAQMLVDMAECSQHDKVAEKKAKLIDLIQKATDPKRQTHSVMDRMQELLDALRNAGEISEDDFHAYREDLRDIERGA